MTTVRIKLTPDGSESEIWLDKKPLKNISMFHLWRDPDGKTHASFELENVTLDIEGETDGAEEKVRGVSASEQQFIPPGFHFKPTQPEPEQPEPIVTESIAETGCVHQWYQLRDGPSGVEQECGRCKAVRTISPR